MSLATLDDLFHNTLRDMYYAEKKLLKALPKMAKASSNTELAEAFQNHLSETEDQVGRIEQVFEIIAKTPRAKKCPAMDGLVEEGEEVIEEGDDDNVKDAGMIAAAQAVEHYEIARYGALVAWANRLDLSDAASLLEESLAEEKAADELLNKIAKDVNESAQGAGEEDEEEEAA
jgi:ferritin-like metal-binding protein YciE